MMSDIGGGAMPATFALSCVAVFFGVSLLAVAIGRKSFGSALIYVLCLVCSVAGLANALAALVLSSTSSVSLPLGLPVIGSHFRIDALSAFFLVVINLGSAAASLFAIGYGRHESAPLRVLPYYPVYLAGMNLVVIADDAFSFLLAWELMSLASWALVLAHHRVEANARAGYIYLLMASAGTLCLLLAFGILAGPDGEYAFAAMREHPLQPHAATIVLVLVMLGAGSKAGLVPLHVWLPLAHPAAPSHVSALMSGVMTKVAVYGFIRILFDLAGDLPWWSGVAVLVVAGITAVTGILYALLQQDLKRILAYSTVENIGVIFVGLGLALAFQANGIGWAAALALTAALFHVFNHSLFKSLLFFGAGSVLNATGQRDMDRLGGLIHRMPKTSFFFLVGCVAISALPPLNGFVSEWLMFQAILVSPQLPQWGPKLTVPAVGALLALAAAFAAACFVRAFGITFLGRPRSDEAASAKEVDRYSLAAMGLLSALCLAAGVMPEFVIEGLKPVTTALVGAAMPQVSGAPPFSIVPIAESRSSYNGMIILIFLVMSGTLTAMFIHRFATRATRRSAIWDCGYPDPSVATQYSSSSFAMPIRRVFGTTMFHLRQTVDMPRPGEMRAGHFRVKVLDPAWRFGFGPMVRWIMYAARRLNALQFLTIRSYLTLTFSALVVLLLVVAAWR
jgi:formate hydrogenlyase subunit 3/multisubunit Na+/H+ antiporter MnhD subunit